MTYHRPQLALDMAEQLLRPKGLQVADMPTAGSVFPRLIGMQVIRQAARDHLACGAEDSPFRPTQSACR